MYVKFAELYSYFLVFLICLYVISQFLTPRTAYAEGPSYELVISNLADSFEQNKTEVLEQRSVDGLKSKRVTLKDIGWSAKPADGGGSEIEKFHFSHFLNDNKELPAWRQSRQFDRLKGLSSRSFGRIAITDQLIQKMKSI